MAVSFLKRAFADDSVESIGLSQIVDVAPSSSNPTYLIVTALDRDKYTAGATGATGSFSGNGHILDFSSQGGDARGAGIVFTYQASTGRYYSTTYGYLDQLTYTSSGSLDDVTNISFFGTNNLALANAYASTVYGLMQTDASGYLGSATVVTEPSFTGTVPTQATPDSIAAVADTFIGKAWNMDGCWVLASTIAAEAGASLPVESTAIGLPGQANGEWMVAFNGPAGQSGNWESMVKEGEIIVIGTAGGGHITTCVSGSGSTAMLVDNITYENASGQVTNLANDGSSNDVTVAAPHLASQEWAGVAASSVVIYELDTPIVTATVASDSISERASLTLAPLFSAADPFGKAVTEYQVYDTLTADSLVMNGSGQADHSAATALTASSLSAVSLLAGATAAADTLEVRAYNGSYWGDWTALSVSVTAAAALAAPVVTSPTASQTWLGGRSFTLALPAGTFTDPQHEALTYKATLSNGQALPSWLTFNPATDTFSGTAPTTPQTVTVTVTAKDTSNLLATETFNATVVGAPIVVAATASQTWTEGQAISLALPAGTFSDPQNQALTYSATLASGQALPSWLTFHAATDSFTGTAPTTAQSLSIKVTATDTGGLSTSETFGATVAPTPKIIVATQTANQVWTDGQTVDLVVPSSTFTDALGLKMTFAAYESGGPNLASWLTFNATTDTFAGRVPSTLTGTATLAVIATDADHATATDMFTVTFGAANAHVAADTVQPTSAMMAAFNPSAPGVLLFHT